MRAQQDSCGNDVPAAAGAHENILKKSTDPDLQANLTSLILAWMRILNR